jgi:hypothetical protein
MMEKKKEEVEFILCNENIYCFFQEIEKKLKINQKRGRIF